MNASEFLAQRKKYSDEDLRSDDNRYYVYRDADKPGDGWYDYVHGNDGDCEPIINAAPAMAAAILKFLAEADGALFSVGLRLEEDYPYLKASLPESLR